MIQTAIDPVVQSAITLILGAVGGAFGTLIALRTKLASMQRDIGDETEARKNLETQLCDRMDTMKQQQTTMLRIVADIARKVGVDGRQFDDALIRMLAGDPSGG